MKEQIDVLTDKIRQSVFQKIMEAGYKDRLWMKKKLEPEKIEPGLVFYPATDNQLEIMEELQNLFQKERIEKKNMPFSVEMKNRICLEIEQDKYRIPFFIEIKPYKETDMYPVEEKWGKLSYYRFPTEEYLARGFYEIFDKLELLNDLSWYKEIYDILLTEAVDGKRVRDCMAKLLEKKRIPSLEKRLDTIKSYENYGYMKKKWKNEKKRQSGDFPEWNQVISLLTIFISPIFNALVKDEIFFEDWMPNLGRYL